MSSLSLNSSLENNQTASSSPRSPPLPPHSKVASICIVLVVTIIILGTVVGNVLVVVAVFTSRALRAPQNLFLVSLASADILVATLVIPFSLANEVSSSQRLITCYRPDLMWLSINNQQLDCLNKNYLTQDAK